MDADDGSAAMEAFYVSLHALSTHAQQSSSSSGSDSGFAFLEQLARALEMLEDRLASEGANADVYEEVVEGCRSKVVNAVSGMFANDVRNLVTVSRKRLISKAALSVEAAGNAHNQRHINTLIELLGQWSNIVADLRGALTAGGRRADHASAAKLLKAIVAPFHLRVIEVAFDCFEQFKADKSVHAWQEKLLTHEIGGSDKYNISSLDYILSQMAAMRDVVDRYYEFIGEVLNEGSAEVVAAGVERSRWRELDAIYIALECGYISYATDEALRERALLETETGGVYTPQAVEDVFYLFARAAERSIQTLSPNSMLAIGGRIAEYLDPRGSGSGQRGLYAFLSDRDLYRGCVESNAIRSRLHEDVGSGTGRSVDMGAAAIFTDGIATCSSEAAGLFAETGVVMSGVNHFLNMIAPLPEPPAATSPPPPPPPPQQQQQHSAGPPAAQGGFEGLEQLIVSALEDAALGGDTSDLPLSLEDHAVFINALGVAPTAIRSLAALFDRCASGVQRSEPLAIVRSEFDKLHAAYHEVFSGEIHQFTVSLFDRYFFSDCVESFSRSYDIAGDAMETRSGTNECARALRALLGAGGRGFKELGARVSTYAYGEVLKEFASLFTETVCTQVVMQKRFNEWGALLLQGEVSAAVRVFEEADSDCDNISIQVMFEKLKWTVKILSIIQPVDIQRYHIPSSCMSEELVRSIMGRRVDLSRVAVENVKLTFV